MARRFQRGPTHTRRRGWPLAAARTRRPRAKRAALEDAETSGPDRPSLDKPRLHADGASLLAGVQRATPYALRHRFASLLLHEGRLVIYVARQLGHDARPTLGTYGHVIDELEGAPQMPAEDAIRAAHDTRCAVGVPSEG